MKLDALVVGAGPVGLSAALFLARHGLRVRLIDQSAGRAAESRAIGIQARTLEILEMAGAVDEFTSLGHQMKGVTLHGEHGAPIGRVAFEHLPTRYPYLLALPQSETERILAAHLARHAVRVDRQTTLLSFIDDGGQVIAKVRDANGGEEDITADWLIGADGAHSTVRRSLGTQFVGKMYDLTFLLADVHLDWTLSQDQAQIFAKTEGLLAIFPLGGGRYRLIADNPPRLFSENEKPTLEEWQQIVDRRASVPMRLFDPNWTAYFHIHARLAEHLRKGRAFLMGDAAHIHSPALAQGMNTGIHDAWNLAWKLAMVQRGDAPSEFLDSYEAERLPVERRVLAITDFTQTVIATDSRLRQALRDLLLPLALHVPFIREKGSETVSELSVGYRGSPIVEDHHAPSRGPHAGERAPDATMIDAQGGSVRLMSLFGLRHVLLIWGDGRSGSTAETAGLAADVADKFSDLVNVYQITASGATAISEGATTLRCQDDQFLERYGKPGAIFLIRPDGYIAFRSDANHPAGVRDYLARHYRAPIGQAR